MARVERVMYVISGFLILAYGILVFSDVTFRYVFNSPVQATLEIVEFSVVAIVFLALPSIEARKEHIRVTMLWQRTHGSTRSLLNLLSLLTGLGVLILIGWQGGLAAWEAWRGNYVTMGTLPLPVWPAKAFIPVGASLASIRVVISMWREARRFGGRTAAISKELL